MLLLINAEEIVQLAINCRADVVVPIYRFLSESLCFAEELVKNNIVFLVDDERGDSSFSK